MSWLSWDTKLEVYTPNSSGRWLGTSDRYELSFDLDHSEARRIIDYIAVHDLASEVGATKMYWRA